MKKPGIPSPPYDPSRARFDSALKETLEQITGVRGTRITQLNANASLSDVITKINELITVLQ